MRGKPGRPAKRDLKEIVAQAIVSAIPVLPPVDPASLRGHESTIERSGLTLIVCELVFAGHSNVAIGKRLGIGNDTVDRFIKSPYFKAVYEQQREAMLASVDEKARERVQEIYLQAIEKKYDIMMDSTTGRGLADKIATDFIQMAERMLKIGRGNISDELKAIFEKTYTMRGENGGETKVTARLVGSPEAVASAAGSLRHTDDATGGGTSTPPPSEDGDRGGEGGATEVESGPLAPWDRQQNGGDGVQPVTPPSGDGGGGTPEGSVREAGGE